MENLSKLAGSIRCSPIFMSRILIMVLAKAVWCEMRLTARFSPSRSVGSNGFVPTVRYSPFMCVDQTRQVILQPRRIISDAK